MGNFEVFSQFNSSSIYLKLSHVFSGVHIDINYRIRFQGWDAQTCVLYYKQRKFTQIK